MKSMKVMNSILTLLFSNLILALCLYLTWNILSEAGWPSASGIVDHAFIGSRKDPYSRFGSALHSLNLAYAYEVNGKKYFNVSEIEYSRSKTDILLRSKDFGPGKKISVRYNQNKPEDTYLNHQVAEAPLPVLITVAAFCLLCTIWALSGLATSLFRRTSQSQ